MNNNQQIESVQNPYEKYLTYRDQIGRYKRAVQGRVLFRGAADRLCHDGRPSDVFSVLYWSD